MKKALALILALLCAGSWAFGAARTQQSSVPTLVWYSLGHPDVEGGEDVRLLSDYMQEKIGARLEIRPYDNDDRMRMIITSGESFDLAWSSEYVYQEFVNIGGYADITDLLPVQSPALWNFIPQMIWDGAKVKGRIYAAPIYKDTSATLFGFLDERYVQKYNIDTTVTLNNYMADLDRILRTIKTGEGSQFYPLYMAKGGIMSNYTTANRYDDLSAGLSNFMGVRLNDPNRRVVSILEQPEVLAAYRIVHKWYQDGIINPDAPQAESTPKGRVFLFDQAWPSKAQTQAALEGVERYVPIQLTTPVISTSSIRGSMLNVGANSRYKNEALKFIELINTDHKFRDMLAYGIEGRHFRYVSPNVVERLTDTYMPYEWAQGTFFNLSTTSDQPATTWDEVRAQNEAADVSVLNGFSMDISGFRNELANISAISQRYMGDISNGSSDPDVMIPRLLAELRAAGFDRIIAEAQRQIDDFYK